MKKVDFLRQCATKANVSQRQVKEILEAMEDVIVEGMKDEEGVTPFLGIKLCAVYKDAHIGRNPSTGEPIQIAAKYVPKAKFGVAIKEAINS